MLWSKAGAGVAGRRTRPPSECLMSPPAYYTQTARSSHFMTKVQWEQKLSLVMPRICSRSSIVLWNPCSLIQCETCNTCDAMVSLAYRVSVSDTFSFGSTRWVLKQTARVSHSLPKSKKYKRIQNSDEHISFLKRKKHLACRPVFMNNSKTLKVGPTFLTLQRKVSWKPLGKERKSCKTYFKTLIVD